MWRRPRRRAAEMRGRPLSKERDAAAENSEQDDIVEPVSVEVAGNQQSGSFVDTRSRNLGRQLPGDQREGR